MAGDDSVPEKTFFAQPGRAGLQQLTEQMCRCLDDPCIKVVLEAVNGFVLILNENRQILAANQELLDALERHDPSCVVGLRVGEAFNCIHFTEGTDGCGTSRHCRTCGAVLAILAAQSHGTPAEDHCRLSTFRDGSLHAIDLKVRATPLQINGHSLTAFVLHDISALKRREVLEQIFLHDFLNAIGGIAGWSELLKEADPLVAAREIAALAESLKEEVITQRTLLDAERGELAVRPREFDVAEVMSKLELVFRQHAIARGKALSIAALPLRTKIVSDQVLLLRVLINMLKNAFEASEPGGIVQLGFDWDGGSPAFFVRNDGVMPEYVQARVFERSFSTRSEHGRGIGTYSIKLYGERYLGGKVSFTSAEAGGTRFILTLPPEQDTVAAPGVAPALDLGDAAARRVLLVDDDEVLLRLGQLLLEQVGYSLAACRSGMEALEAFRAAPGSFDAVVTDWSMPGMGGEELIRRLLALRPGIPIVVCTGMGEAAVTTPGIHSCIGKPFTFRELSESLERAFAGNAKRQSAGPPSGF